MRSWTRQNIDLLEYLVRRAALIEMPSRVMRPFWRKYSPDQPRVPAGSREGGQWTSDGAGTLSRTRQENPKPVRLADVSNALGSRVMSDANPDPIRPGARYATTLPVFMPNTLVGDPRIVSTTIKLNTILAHAMEVIEPGSDALTPQEYGRLVHEKFADTVRVLGLPGIGYDDVETTFGGAYYGAKDSIRTDVVLRDEAGKVIAIYDVKTGNADMRPARAAELRIRVGVDNSVPIYQLKILRIDRKAFTSSVRAAWTFPINS